jgi:hypothetical protein
MTAQYYFIIRKQHLIFLLKILLQAKSMTSESCVLVSSTYTTFIIVRLCKTRFWEWAISNVESCPMFGQTLQFPSSVWICICWSLSVAFCRTESGWGIGCNGADLWSTRVSCCSSNVCQNLGQHSTFWCGSFSEAKVLCWTPTTKT